jgi:hypothetical protein
MNPKKHNKFTNKFLQLSDYQISIDCGCLELGVGGLRLGLEVFYIYNKIFPDHYSQTPAV